MIIQLPSPQTKDLMNMSAGTAGLSHAAAPQLTSYNLEANITNTNSSKDTMAFKNPLPTDIPERPWTHPSTRLRFDGPDQDDSTYTVICGLRTIPTRFLIWFNLPLCWLVGLVIATRHINTWLSAHFSGPDQSTVAIALVVTYIVYTILAHTVAVYAAIVYELWRNPYARAPSLRGEVGREEEVAMATRNRVIAKRMGRTFLPCLEWRS